MSPNVFDINEDKIYKDNCIVVNFMQCSFLLCYRKNVGPVNILQDQQMLGVTGSTGPVSFWVRVEACSLLPFSLIMLSSWFILISHIL